MAFDGAITSKAKAKTIHAVDLFCGAGGTSTGMLSAIEDLGWKPKLIAINHWNVAIDTHYKNHPDVKHLCQSIDSIDPIKEVPGGRLQLLVASPECTHHSNARGGKPRSDQKRADAWLLLRWINNLYIENILIENVKEFESWGPLTAKGLPDKRHKGQYFQQFIAALRINYNVEYKVLNCADYGDPTTRERLFIMARRNGKKINWPARTHASRKELAKMAAQPELFGSSEQLKPWVAAREIIDWSLEGKSIFGRKKPLSPNTMRRIFKGLEKHGLKNFMVNLKNRDRRDRSVDEPTFTQAAGGNHQAVVEPFIVPQFSSPDTRDINEPAPTITTTSRGVGVVEVEPFTLSVERAQTNRSLPRSVEEPIGTVLGTPRIGIVEGEVQPFTISAGGPELEAKSVEEPLRTVLTRDHQAIIEAFLVKFHGGTNGQNRNYPVDEPIGTLDTSNRFGLVEAEPFIVSAAHGGNTNPPRDIDEPLGSVLGSPKFGVVETEPFLIPFFGERQGQEPRTRDINEPAPTVTTHGRMGVVESEAFLLGQQSDAALRSVDEPSPTIAGAGAIAKVDVEPFVVNMKGQSDARSIEDPLFTQTIKQHQYLAEPYIIKFYGSGENAESIDDPLATVTAKDRFALCIPTLGIALDIRFRMLQPHELAAAMSFPKDYEFTGNREAKVKQIGNAVPLKTAKALCTALLT
jgi:DNA (cytosine-5)-methyltransferase 1